MPLATPIDATPEQLARVRYDADGLVPAIVQEHGTGRVLTLAWMNVDSLAESLGTGRTVFWSRSRQERWRKGDTSGDRQWIRQAFLDCDGDAVLLVVEQEGAGACHTGSRSCFSAPFGAPAPTVGEAQPLAGRMGPAGRTGLAGHTGPAGHTGAVGRSMP